MRQALAFATVDGRATLALRPLGRRADLPLTSLWLAREFAAERGASDASFSGDSSIQNL